MSYADPTNTGPQPSRYEPICSEYAPFSGAEEQTARAISAYARYACLLSLQMGSIKKTRLRRPGWHLWAFSWLAHV